MVPARDKKNNAYSQYRLGQLYALGKGVPQNDIEAVKLYALAANQGYVQAQTNLGGMYREGKGVGKNDATAFMWFVLAAQKGDHLAQYNLSRMYFEGAGVERDIQKAYLWMYFSASQNFKLAQGDIRVIEQKMTKDQVAAVQVQIHNCKNNLFKGC